MAGTGWRWAVKMCVWGRGKVFSRVLAKALMVWVASRAEFGKKCDFPNVSAEGAHGLNPFFPKMLIAPEYRRRGDSAGQVEH